MPAEPATGLEPIDGGRDAPVAPARAPSGRFAKLVGGIFATRVVQFALALPTSILISRLLGPADKGAFVAITTLPGMLATLGLLGLPSAINYYAGRGSSIRSLVRAIVVFTIGLSVVLVGIVWIALPWLESTFLRAAPDPFARLILATVPLGMLATFGGALLYGRQAIRTYNIVLVIQSVLTLLSAVVLVGVLGAGLVGAVGGSILSISFLAISVALIVAGLRRRDLAGNPVALRSLGSYGARLYPASVTGYFNYRADTYLIQALLMAPGRALGLYSIAVTFAELIFYVPDSVSTMLLPRVAGSTDSEAIAFAARIGRLTMLITLLGAVALIPAAIIGINVVLPAYADAIPAFLALLPGVVVLSVAKVMTSYLSGRGRPGVVSMGAVVALVVNVGLNVALIPAFGIVGASLASVVSYGSLAAMMVVAAARLGRAPMASLFVPGRTEVSLVLDAARALSQRRAARWRSRSTSGDGAGRANP